MEEIRNEWYSRLEDLKEDVERLGYTVEDLNNEIITISYEEDGEDIYETYRLGGTGTTIYVDIDSKMVDVVA